MSLHPPILYYTMTVCLNWSTAIEGKGLTLESARHDLMANALSKLKGPSLRRVAIALSGGEEP